MVGGDDNLIARAKAGDAEAFGALYDRWHSPIYRFLVLRTGSRPEAEDLTHQVFLAAFEHIGGYADEGYPISSWLYRIARNRLIDHYRLRRDMATLDSAEAENIVHEGDVELDVDEALTMEHVREALLSLPPQYQEVIILRFIEELSIKEASAAMERSEGAIKVLQHRALQELKKKLDA